MREVDVQSREFVIFQDLNLLDVDAHAFFRGIRKIVRRGCRASKVDLFREPERLVLSNTKTYEENDPNSRLQESFETFRYLFTQRVPHQWHVAVYSAMGPCSSPARSDLLLSSFHVRILGNIVDR